MIAFGGVLVHRKIFKEVNSILYNGVNQSKYQIYTKPEIINNILKLLTNKNKKLKHRMKKV